MNTKPLLWLLIGIALMLASAAALKHFAIFKPGEPAPGEPWVEPATGMQFVWIPAGCFTMGSDKGRDNEKPAHRVCVKGFYIGRYEVKQAEYEQIVGVNPCSKECSRFLGHDRPVTNIRRGDALSMAETFSRKAGRRFRFPSEAEWEYACLAGGQHKLYCGDGQLWELGWIAKSRPESVGGKKPNAWGLFDMIGNVSEFVQDCWHGNYNGAPGDGSAWIDGGYCYGRVSRGGSWDSPESVDAKSRGYQEIDSRFIPTGNGVRLVMER